MGQRLVVIGGDAAGGSAASQARKRQPDLDVVMFERGRSTSYSACGIPYWISGTVDDEAALVARTPEQHRAAGIDVRMRTEVVGIDLDRRTVAWRDLDERGGGQRAVRRPGLRDRQRAHAPARAGHRRRRCLRRAGARRRRGAAGRARPGLGPPGRRRRGRLHRPGDRRGAAGSAVSTSPSSTSPRRRSARSTPTWGRRSPRPSAGRASTWCCPTGWPPSTWGPTAGPAPSSPRAAASCPPTSWCSASASGRTSRWPGRRASRSGTSGGVAVDARMRTGVEGVWAAGDCVESVHRLSGQPVHVPLGTHANKQGRVAGINIGGGYATFPGSSAPPSRRSATSRSPAPACRRARGRGGRVLVRPGRRRLDHPGRLLPGRRADDRQADRRAAQRPAARRPDRRPAGAAKRIDALAIGIWNEMTVDEILSSTCPTPRRSRRCGTRCSSPPGRRSRPWRPTSARCDSGRGRGTVSGRSPRRSASRSPRSGRGRRGRSVCVSPSRVVARTVIVCRPAAKSWGSTHWRQTSSPTSGDSSAAIQSPSSTLTSTRPMPRVCAHATPATARRPAVNVRPDAGVSMRDSTLIGPLAAQPRSHPVRVERVEGRGLDPGEPLAGRHVAVEAGDDHPHREAVLDRQRLAVHAEGQHRVVDRRAPSAWARRWS